MRRNFYLTILPGILLLAWSVASPQTAPPPPAAAPAGHDYAAEYAATLKLVQQGDLTGDLRAFRIAGILASGGHGTVKEGGDRAAFRKLAESRDFQDALDSANQALARNYASIVNHFDAMVACQALQKTEEAAGHEKLLNALLDSIQKSGDGKSPNTAWFVVTTTEEYVFLSRILGLKAKSQKFSQAEGHFFDLLEVFDPKTNESRSVWFNTDVDLGGYRPPDQGKGGSVH